MQMFSYTNYYIIYILYGLIIYYYGKFKNITVKLSQLIKLIKVVLTIILTWGIRGCYILKSN